MIVQETQGPSGRAKLPGVRMALLIALVTLSALAGVVAILAARPSASPASSTFPSVFYQTKASDIIDSTIQIQKTGYVPEASKVSGPGGLGTEDWVEMADPSGSAANMSVAVFGSVGAAEKYYSSFVANQRVLPGYDEISSDLSSFQGYGGCFANGEDVDSIAVINGICTKGNVVIWIHLVSSVDFSQLETDLTNLMGTVYSVVGQA